MSSSRQEETTGSSTRSTAADHGAKGQLLDAIVDFVNRRAVDSAPIQSGARSVTVGDFLRMLLPSAAGMTGSSGRELARWLDVAIARLDEVLQRQVTAILHHPRFQRLEAGWRGLAYLTNQVELAELIGEEDGTEVTIKIRVFSVTKDEIHKDVMGVLEFDQSLLWQRVYEDEFGTAGGTPYGVLIGDYEFSNTPRDITLMERLAETAAAAFVPFIAGASPQLLGVDGFGALQHHIDLSHLDGPDYLRWRSFRNELDARFFGLTLPRVLLRLPYDGRQAYTPVDFRFVEDVASPDGSDYLWGNAAFAFGGVLIRAFAECGWFADIRGLERGKVGGGLVTGLPVHSFNTDRPGISIKASTDVIVDEFQESRLSAMGLIPLCTCQDTGYSVFYSNQSLHKPEKFSDVVKTTNARISAMLQYVFCTSRFAHYLKVLGREWIGSSQSGFELEDKLTRWINDYVNPDERADPKFKARYPLRQAEVQIEEELDAPGSYRMIMRLLPHYQLDELRAAVRLESRMTRRASNG